MQNMDRSLPKRILNCLCCMFLHVTYAFQSESTLYSCLAQYLKFKWLLWLSCVVSTYLYGVFEWIHTLKLPECQGTSCLKQARYLKFKWLMIELCCEYLPVRCIWLHILIMSRTLFKVNPHLIFAWMWRSSLLETGQFG